VKTGDGREGKEGKGRKGKERKGSVQYKTVKVSKKESDHVSSPYAVQMPNISAMMLIVVVVLLQSRSANENEGYEWKGPRTPNRTPTTQKQDR
jgi:hypothetical protein